MLTTPKKYLLHPRYAWITWPGIIATGGLLTWHPALLALTAVPIYCWLRLHHLYPHERRWLNKIRSQTRAQDIDAAITFLDKGTVFAGYTARLRAQQLRVRVLLRAGREHEAQQLLFSIDTAAMTDDEMVGYKGLLAIYYQRTGDIKTFLDEVATWDKAQVEESTEHSLLKGQALQEEGDLLAARECLEARIEREKGAVELRQLYNNLAVIARLAGRTLQQMEYLETAWRYWRKAPDPDSMNYLAHNLAINKVRNGQHSAAKQIVDEAYAKLDRQSVGQLLMWHNLSVEVAREMGDMRWLHQTRADLDSHYAPLRMTVSEQVSLAISRLRMDFNDGLATDLAAHPVKLNELLDSVCQLEEKEQLPALKEISHNLEQVMGLVAEEWETTVKSPLLKALRHTLERCDRLVMKQAGQITEQLQILPPRLINQRQYWLGMLHHQYKVEICRTEGYPEQAMHSLIQNQRESAELYQEKGAIYAALQAWTVICDEYVAYMQQFEPDMQARLQQQCQTQAIQALEQVERLITERKYTAGLEEYMVALAYFSLQLGHGCDRARYWLERFEHSGVGINHYAQWLKEQYWWVKKVVAQAGSDCTAQLLRKPGEKQGKCSRHLKVEG